MVNNKIENNQTEEVTLKDFLFKIRDWWRFLLSRWKLIILVGIIGGIIGFIYAWQKKPVYKAELSFVVQAEKSNTSGLAGALGIANQLGVDLNGGGSDGGEFSGDNLLTLMKSRSMVEKALLTNITVNGNVETMAEFYIDFNRMRENWVNSPDKNLHFLPNINRTSFSLQQDSLLGVIYKRIINDNLVIDKIDKKLSIVSISVNSINEKFSKEFTEVLTKVVSAFYVQTKTEKLSKNVAVLQKQTDSVRNILNAAILGVATNSDANPNPNPLLQSLRVPSQRRQFDVQANTAILNQLIANLEIAKMSLLQETPLIQVIDKPILPLEKDRIGKIKGFVIGMIMSIFLVSFCLTMKNFLRRILN